MPTPPIGSSPDVSDDSADLIRSLDRQAALCRELRSMAQRQREALADHRTGAFLEIVADRQSLIDELCLLSSECHRFFEPDSAALADLPAPQQDRVLSLRDSVMRDVESVLDSDQADRATVAQQREEIDRELRSVASGRASNRAYSGAQSEAAAGKHTRFTDRRG